MKTSGFNYQTLPSVIDMTQRTAITFEVQTCKDAYIGLFKYSPAPNDIVSEIVLGAFNNKISEIRDKMQGHVHSDYNWKVLDCVRKKPFWISWADGQIQVGTGKSVGTNRIMDWNTNLTLHVDVISVSSYYMSIATWLFDIGITFV